MSSLPAASLPLCGDTWAQGRRCCGPGHLPLLSGGPLALEDASPFGEGAGRPAGLSRLRRRGVLHPGPCQRTALCVCACVRWWGSSSRKGRVWPPSQKPCGAQWRWVGARARPAQVEPGPQPRAAATASSVPQLLCLCSGGRARQFSPLQAGVGSLARPLGRCLGGAHGARVWPCGKGQGARCSRASPRTALQRSSTPATQLPGLPAAEAVLGGKGWSLLLYLRDPHIFCPSCPDFLCKPGNAHVSEGPLVFRLGTA